MIRTLTVLLTVIITLGGCDTGPESPRGFSLPAGDTANGKVVFTDFGCLSCHTLDGVEIADIEKDPTISVALGGEVTRIKTYAELVTSVINPSHKIAKGYPQAMVMEEGESKMVNYNDIMTVTQLTDLVTFLQPYYTLKAYEPTTYTGFH